MTTINTALRPVECRDAVILCLESGLVPMITSSPGMGKSSMVREIAKLANLELLDMRMSQMTPEDMMGLPFRNADGRAEFMPFVDFPLDGDALPKDKDGWLLFLDEFNSAPKMVQAAAYKLILDRMVGAKHLHPNVHVVCAGNKMTDGAIVNQLSTAMQSRLVHLELDLNHRDFMDMATRNNFDYRVLGFLEYKPRNLSNFSPEHSDKTFACPRTWEFVSKLFSGRLTKEVPMAVVAGTIGQGMAVEFMNFARHYDQIPTMDEILSSPSGAKVPLDSGPRFAVVSMLQDKFHLNDFDKHVDYVERLPAEMQIIYFRGVLRRHPKIRSHKTFTRLSHKIVTYLKDDSDDTFRSAA